MANRFRAEWSGSFGSIYILEPWESAISVTEEFLNTVTAPFSLVSGDILTLICTNGSASYQLLRRHEVDIENAIYRCRLIEGVWSLRD